MTEVQTLQMKRTVMLEAKGAIERRLDQPLADQMNDYENLSREEDQLYWAHDVGDAILSAPVASIADVIVKIDIILQNGQECLEAIRAKEVLAQMVDEITTLKRQVAEFNGARSTVGD